MKLDFLEFRNVNKSQTQIQLLELVIRTLVKPFDRSAAFMMSINLFRSKPTIVSREDGKIDS